MVATINKVDTVIKLGNKPPSHNIKVLAQAGLRSELEIATDEMERAQRQLAALEKQREVLQQGSAAASPRAAVSAPTASSALEDSLRKELQSQVCSLNHLTHNSPPASHRLSSCTQHIANALPKCCVAASNAKTSTAGRQSL